MFSTDQIIISQDLPCRAILPTTSIAADCDASDGFSPITGKPLYIGVYGYKGTTLSYIKIEITTFVSVKVYDPNGSY